MSSLSNPPTELSQAASASEEKLKPTPKQGDLGKKIGVEKDILPGLYRKREYGMLPAMDSNELKNRKAKKRKLENKLKISENNRLQHKKIGVDRKQKMLSLEESTRKMITGRTEVRPGAPIKVDKMELISAVTKIAITLCSHLNS